MRYNLEAVRKNLYGLLVLSLLCLAGCASMQTKRTYQQTVVDAVYPEINLSARTGTENINGAFPEKIHVNTLVQVSSFGFDFCLHDGKIYHKKSGETDWVLMPPSGLPFSETDTTFIHPEEIVEIAADADCLYAFSNEGILYRYYFRKIRTEKLDTWIMNFGWPVPSVLKQNILVSNKRGWGMGVRRGDILWYEDIYGNQHHYGTMGLETLYFLSDDGQSIHFTDSGLPADFSHLIQGPEKGSFIAENISVSGSTIFLINKNGEMYTRLIDFDTMGCDPMFFKYTYEKKEQAYSGSDYRSNFTPWALPAEPWKKQPPVPLSGQARISRFISILQNGQGNSARELRIAGLSKDGYTGYYTKQIDDDEWRFAFAPLYIPEAAFLEPEPDTGKFRGEPTNFSYEGYASKDGIMIPEFECSVRDFSLASEGKAVLSLSSGKGDRAGAVEIDLHFVEVWTYLRRIAPGFDGSPRQFFVTPEFNPEDLESGGEKFSGMLQEIFGDKNKSLFSCYLEATTDYFQLMIKGKEHDFSFFLTSDNMPPVNPEIAKGTMFYEEDITGIFESGELVLPQKEDGFSRDDVALIQEKIQKNTEVVKFLEEEIEVYNFFHRNSSHFRWGYSFLDLLTTITFLDKIDFPKIKTLTMFGRDIVQINNQNFRQMADLREWIYTHFIELSRTRIEYYTKLIEEIEKTEAPVFPDAHVFDTFPEYFASIGIPQISSGTLSVFDCEAKLYFSDELAFFPGFFLAFNINGEDVVFLLELENSLEKICCLPLSGNLKEILNGSPFHVKTHILLLTAIDNAETYNMLQDFMNTSMVFEWDGTNIRLRKGRASGKILLETFPLEEEKDVNRLIPSVPGDKNQPEE